MRTVKFILFMLAFYIPTSYAQVLNPGFENLNSDSSIQHWGISILQSVSFDSIGLPHADSVVVDQNYNQTTTDAHSGTRAMEMRNAYNYTSNKGIPGGAICSLDSIFSTYSGFLPITVRPSSLNFYYKYFPVNSDTASAIIHVRDINGIEIGKGLVYLYQLKANYTYASAPIVYTSSAQAFFIDIQFNASSRKQQAQFGTRFLVDDIDLNTPSSITNVNMPFLCTVYPNPSNSICYIQSEATIQSISVFNLYGQLVFQQQGNVHSVNTSRLSNACYMLRISTQKGIQTTMLQITHP